MDFDGRGAVLSWTAIALLILAFPARADDEPSGPAARVGRPTPDAAAAAALLARLQGANRASLAKSPQDEPKSPEALFQELYGPLPSAEPPAAPERAAQQPAAADLPDALPPKSQAPVAVPAGGPIPPGAVKVDEDGRMSMHLDNVDVRRTLELISRVGSLNILVSPGTAGAVTINLEGVTIDQALDAILRLANLVARRESNIIYVYTADETARLDGLQRRPGTRVYRLNYVRSGDLEEMIKPFLSATGKMTVTPPSDQGIGGGTNLFGSFSQGGGGAAGGGGGGGGSGGGSGGGGGGGAGARAVTGGNTMAGGDVVVIQDDEEVLRTIDTIVLQLDVQPLQVLVEAVIMSVELDRAVDLGINFAVLDNLLGKSALQVGPNLVSNGVAGAGAAAAASVAPTATQILAAGNSLASNLASSAAGIKFGFTDHGIAGFIRALETVGQVNVLASPRILVLNKQRAEIQLGNRLGYQTLTQNFTSTIQQVQFLNTGTLLRFRPFVSHDGMIRMEVHPERSSGQVVNNLPQSNTSEVTTNVLIPDGATIVIGGLIENNDNNQVQGVFGATRVPVIGPFLRQRQQTATKKELIVLLTCRIWNPGVTNAPQAMRLAANRADTDRPSARIAAGDRNNRRPREADQEFESEPSAADVPPPVPRPGPPVFAPSEPPATSRAPAEPTARRNGGTGQRRRSLVDDQVQRAGGTQAVRLPNEPDSWRAAAQPQRRAAAPRAQPYPTWQVRPNETLRSIARDALGDARRADEILRLNLDSIDPSRRLSPGQLLYLPRDARTGERGDWAR
jgi:type II secretory pathway component GspD/PulD (secretin)